MSTYTNFTDQELGEILSNHEKLSFIGRLELKKEILKRNTVFADKHIQGLDTEIDQQKKDVKELKYLKNLGFKIEHLGTNSFKISISGKGDFIDIFAVIVGIILVLFGFYSLTNITNVFSFILALLLLTGAYYGFKMIFNGINRLIEYSNFNFTCINNRFILKKRFDLKSIQIEGKISSLSIKNFEKHSSLNTENQEIIRVDAPNSINTETLEGILELAQELKE